MVSGRLIIAVVALVLAVVFVVQNTQRVRIHFVFFTVSSRLWIGFIVCLVLGALLGQVLGLLRRRRS
jgi:lipopolysaccharide assembly protein A